MSQGLMSGGEGGTKENGSSEGAYFVLLLKCRVYDIAYENIFFCDYDVNRNFMYKLCSEPE